MVNYNLLSQISREKSSQKQTHFREPSVCILPINLSNNEHASVDTDQHKKHIKVTGKTFENVGDWYLTGTLDSYARCGEFVRALGCEDFGKDSLKHDRIIETYSCHRPGCPTCYESWAFREAEKATERLLEGQKLYREAGKKYTLKHVVFSPDSSEHKHIKQMLDQGRYNVLKQKLLSFIKEAGAIGGCITPHWWRQVGEKEALPDNVTVPKDKKEGEWYFSPHFHTIIGGFMVPSNVFYAKTNWVYKNLGKRKSIKDTIFYFLTHCANHEKHHAVTWFGIYGYRQMQIDFIELKEATVPCSACGKSLHEYELDYSFDKIDTLEPNWDVDYGIHYRKIKIRHFKLREADNEFIDTLKAGLNWDTL